jgi:hypothetical protein
VRAADHRETDGRILAAILTDQHGLGRRLKAADGDVYGILTSVINSDSAIRRRELRTSAAHQRNDSD